MRRLFGIAAIAALAALAVFTHLTVTNLVARPGPTLPAATAAWGDDSTRLELSETIGSPSEPLPPGILPPPQFGRDPAIERAQRLHVRRVGTIGDKAYVLGQSDIYNRDGIADYVWRVTVLEEEGENPVYERYFLEDPVRVPAGIGKSIIFEKVIETGLPEGDYIIELAFVDIVDVLAGRDRELGMAVVSRRPISID